jgi:hypothetical protein
MPALCDDDQLRAPQAAQVEELRLAKGVALGSPGIVVVRSDPRDGMGASTLSRADLPVDDSRSHFWATDYTPD